MAFNKGLEILFFLLVITVNKNNSQPLTESVFFSLTEGQVRFAELRCLQKFPQAEIANYTDTFETRCFLHCFLQKIGLMDLGTRGIHTIKLLDIWETIGTFKDDNCLERFDFSEPLSGTCSDTYRKLMEFRENCLELFEYIFSSETRTILESKNSKISKKIGQSATEFCEDNEKEYAAAKENSQDSELSILSVYKNKLKCIFENIHYLDAYGRIDENEINLSYQEAKEDGFESRAIVRICSHRANSKYQQDYLADTVLELQKCLKTRSPTFSKVFSQRDENSRKY